VRTSSNPAFRRLPTSPGGYARFGEGPAGLGGGFGGGPGGPAPVAGATDRPLTVDDVVQKTALNAVVTIAVGVLTAISGLYLLGIVGFIVGFVIALVIIFKQSTNPALVLTYSVSQGMALGALTGALEASSNQYAGIGFQAILGVVGVFIGMLVVYKTGAIRVTPKFTRWVVGALFGAVALMIVNLIVGLFTHSAGPLRDGGPMAIVFSLVMIGIAAFSFLIDFDQADQAIRAGAPEKAAWGIALGLTVTLVWLYLEILRLLSYFRN